MNSCLYMHLYEDLKFSWTCESNLSSHISFSFHLKFSVFLFTSLFRQQFILCFSVPLWQICEIIFWLKLSQNVHILYLYSGKNFATQNHVPIVSVVLLHDKTTPYGATISRTAKIHGTDFQREENNFQKFIKSMEFHSCGKLLSIVCQKHACFLN